ncbi:4-(cytidine 5'-diphospho)-2-C-methyl-D-erythritol kinase [Lutimaribacter marinistellae]|uniref:4-diphosphocytidyl-2-C-methyl-D-erythritol kinase n=1 Tax=Lutimaribacter marinistellae TaxID=1820329 RepID=A0ABV7TF88_9RHOB
MSKGFAPAKINLTLHVTGRRPDGYHLLDSLVAFASIGDTVSARVADKLSLSVSGPMAAGVPEDSSNLVWRAAEWLGGLRGAVLELEKHLPAASGIGGGSSDAAAAIRLLSELWTVDLPSASETASLGADLPVCLDPRPRRMQGVGERLSDPLVLPPTEIVLVNPGVQVETPAVFRVLDRADNDAMPDDLPAWADETALAEWLHTQRNDLQVPACNLRPEIGEVLTELDLMAPLIARMSGSGATCFALFPDGSGAAETACDKLSRAHPEWWCRAGRLL